MATATVCRLVERAALHGRVDRAAGVIRGVRVLGENSRNGRRYTLQAMADAAPLYNGVRVFINHPRRDDMDEDRPWQDWVGTLDNVRLESNGLVGDLKLLKNSKHFSALCEAAESQDFNRCFGLSHEADGDASFDRATGMEVVSRIRSVRAVAVVCEPATTAGMFESTRRDTEPRMPWHKPTYTRERLEQFARNLR